MPQLFADSGRGKSVTQIGMLYSVLVFCQAPSSVFADMQVL